MIQGTMLSRRQFLHAMSVSLLAVPTAAEAQGAKKIPRLCFLTFDPGTAQSPSTRFAVFFQSLRDLGYVHGKTITIDYLSASAEVVKSNETVGIGYL